MGRLLSLVSLPVLATRELATTWTVNPDGTGDLPTIQSAVDASSDGDETWGSVKSLYW